MMSKQLDRVCPNCREKFAGWGNQVYCSELCQVAATTYKEWSAQQQGRSKKGRK
jgi:hypothetical protein